MKLIRKPSFLLLGILSGTLFCHGQEVITLSSTKSQAALLIYTFLKLTKKTSTIQEIDDYYEFLRTTEQGALHYGISTAITESITGTPSQASLATATLDSSGYIATSWLIRTLYDAFFETKSGIALQQALENANIIPKGSEKLFQEATIGILSTITYAHLKKWISLLVPA